MTNRKDSDKQLTRVRQLPFQKDSNMPPKDPKVEPDKIIDAEVKGDKKPGTALVHWRDKMVAVTKATQEAEKPQGGFISFKGGRMTYNDELLPGDMIRCVIVDYRMDNEFYTGAYNPQKVQSPSCFAITKPGDMVQPWRLPMEGEDISNLEQQDDGYGVLYVSDAEDPQVDVGIGCESCPQFQWGSGVGQDGKPTKGKACKTSRRLHIIAADELAKGPEGIRKASVMSMIPPATSVENFQLMMNQISNVLGAPMFGAVVDISVKPHDRFLFMVHFKIIDSIKDESLLEALYYKHEQQAGRHITYMKNSERDGNSPDPRAQSSKY